MTAPDPNEDQRRFWSEEAGAVWVRQADLTDRAFSGVLAALLDRAALSPGQRVLDIGCGAGTSTRAIAKRIAPGGQVTGCDISEPLLAHARALSIGETYLNADAQSHDFAQASADAILSRFGVMFFSDTAGAFANMARALRPGGRMVFATWGAIPENPFFTLPARVAREVLGPVPKSDPDAPGPFALRDAQKTLALFTQAGLSAKVETLDVPLPLGDDLPTLVSALREIGPIAGAFRHHGAGAEAQAETLQALSEALEGFRKDSQIILPSQIHFFTGIKPS